MIGIIRISLCLVALLALAGCDKDFKLIAEDGTETQGILLVHPSPPHEISVSLGGEDFSGYWRSYVVDESEAMKRHYGAWSSTYKAYASGQSSNKLRHAHAILRGSRGSILECEFDYRGERNGRGICDLGGTKYKMVMD